MRRPETVLAPDGRRWIVRRRWNRRPRWRTPGADTFDPLGALFALGDFSITGFLLAVALAVVAAVVLAIVSLLLLPLVLLVAEAVAVAVSLYLLGRPWRIEAVTEGPPPETLVWRVRGWRRSRRAVAEVASELERGVVAEPADADA